MSGNDFLDNNTNQNYISQIQPRASDKESASQTRPEPIFRDKPPKSPVLIGALFGILGLAVGAGCVFGIIKMTEQPAKDCPECTCPKCSSNASALSSLNTAFLSLESNSQNLIYSPLSIRYGLSLLNSGAKGDTKTEITKLLGEETLPKYTNIPDKLSLANAVFIRDSYKNDVLPSYTEEVTKSSNADVQYDSFADSSNMDNWVSQKTFKLIDKLGIQPDSETKMVLANALAIQMDWQYQFDTEYTHGRTFYKADDSEMTATTMNQTTHAEEIKYYLDDDTTLLSMPLQSTEDSALEFVAVMPSESLTDYIEKFDLKTIEDNLSASTPASTPKDGVEIHIPKFKFEYKLDFKKDLGSLGMTKAFTSSADFSNMTSNPDGLYVSDAVHKANIDFSEKGIKAAAVTAFAMRANAAFQEEIPQPVIIDINHPFLFLIRDKNNGAIWFIGTVYEPNLWSDDQSSYQQ